MARAGETGSSRSSRRDAWPETKADEGLKDTTLIPTYRIPRISVESQLVKLSTKAMGILLAEQGPWWI